MDRFQHAVAIVTGGASGIGRALCEELGRRGAVVGVTDLDEAGAREVAARIVAAGGRATKHLAVLPVLPLFIPAGRRAP